MNKSDLLNLKNLIAEIKTLQDELDNLKWKPKEPVIDYAKDYRHGKPKIITLTGYGDKDYAKLKQKLTGSLVKVQRERLRLEEWLDSVEDSEMRNILRLQYVNGLTQEEIADELGYTSRTIRYKLKEFWEKQSD